MSIRDIRQAIEAEGVRVLGVRQNKHMVWSCQCDSKRFNVVTSKSPSDRRSIKNIRAFVRRQLRA